MILANLDNSVEVGLMRLRTQSALSNPVNVISTTIVGVLMSRTNKRGGGKGGTTLKKSFFENSVKLCCRLAKS